MRWVFLVAMALAVGCGKGGRDAPAVPVADPTAAPAVAPPDQPLHGELGQCAEIHIENRSLPLGRNSGYMQVHRLLLDGVLFGSQIREMDRHYFDQFQCLTMAHPLDTIANVGALHAFDIRQEPLSYYHRTGPVGAMFRELRARKGGADAKADVGVLGMKAGTEACYALPAQTLTFYETDPAIKRLVADTDKYFTYVSDARNRGATINIKIGDRRTELKADKERKFALLLVDLYDSTKHPPDLLTTEAVRLYFDRMTDNGILAIHISSKEVRFEPMLARIAEDLKLAVRVWYDDDYRFPGKNASTWMVLAKGEKALGSLALPVTRQQREYGSDFRPAELHPDVPAWTDKNTVVVPAMKFHP